HFILLLAFPLTTGLAGVAPLFTYVFWGKEFNPVADLLVIESAVIVLVGISNAVGVQYLLPTNQLKTFTASVVFGALVNIVLNLPLILLIQSNGAMVATVLSELLVTVYQLIKVRKQL
ncbi:polysaccharide biosynthesis C-terminal domain-containing protein, partial [Levilactobacillus brevis]